MGVYAIPKCPECSGTITVADMMSDTVAECRHCGRTVTLPRPGSDATRNVDHSPAPQKTTQRF